MLLARLYALAAGSAEHSTVLRLQAAAAAGHAELGHAPGS